MINTHSVQWVSAQSYFFEKYPWFLFPERNPSCLARRVLILTATPQTVRSASTPRADKGWSVSVSLFLLLCAGTLLLRAGFLSGGEQGLFFIAVRGLLGVVVSPAEEHRL